jgi:hypothetical protein
MRSTLTTSRLLTLLLSGFLAFGVTACSTRDDTSGDSVQQEGTTTPQDPDGVDNDINTENQNEGDLGQTTTGSDEEGGMPEENNGTPGDQSGAVQTGDTGGGTPDGSQDGASGTDENNGNSGLVGGKGSGTQTSDTDETQDGNVGDEETGN